MDPSRLLQHKLQVAKNNIFVNEEGNVTFNTEVIQLYPPPFSAKQASTGRVESENVIINQTLREIIQNSSCSNSENLLATGHGSDRNLDGSGVSDLHALGHEDENEDPLPENLPNVVTMRDAALAVGSWITLIIYL